MFATRATSRCFYLTLHLQDCSKEEKVVTTLTTAKTNTLSYWISTRTLVLWWWHFLNKDAVWISEAGPRISVTKMAVADPESHFHLPLWDILAHSFNFTDTKQFFYSIWWCTGPHVDYTLDGCGSTTLGAIKGKVPSLTALVAVEDTQYAIEVNLQGSVIWIFLEITLLGEFQVK